MAQVSEKQLDSVRRRMAAVANHLLPIMNTNSNYGSIGLSNASMKDRYHRIHGEVPSHDVVWRTACDESGKEFTDIIYEKAVGEGIAKVRLSTVTFRLIDLTCSECFLLIQLFVFWVV